MSEKLGRSTALVTAAGQGIGRATAIAFANEGATVWASDINENALHLLCQEVPGIQALKLDVRDSGLIADSVHRLGTLDVLFNCAGFVHQGTVLDCLDEDWDFSFDLNVKSMFHMCRACLPGMITSGRGSIINMSSVVSSVRGAPNRFVYGTTKAAVIGLTKSIAVDFIHQGIRCNAICAGTVQSPSLNERISHCDDPQRARSEFVARQPMGRLGKTEEIAALAVYLASDDSSFTTGQIHIIDGGWNA